MEAEHLVDLVPEVGKLERMFEMQKSLQEYLKMDMKSQSYINMNFMALSDELHEFVRNTPWKPWKKQQTLNHHEAKEELVDLFHFFMNLCMAVGMTPEELYNRYQAKNAENISRQKRGY